MRARFWIIPSLLLMVTLLAACGSTSSTDPGTTPSAGLTFTDATHTTITLSKAPTRIVCLVGLCEDILASLNIQPVAVNDSLGQDAHYFGDAAKSFAKIGGQFNDPNIEDIATATPDLVIGVANAHEQLREALKPIAPLYIMNPASYTDSITYLKDIGRLTGHSTQADTAAQAFQRKIDLYKEKSPKSKSVVLIYGSDVNFNVFTSGSLPGSVLSQVTTYAFGTTGAGTSPSSDHEPGAISGSLESMLATNPDAILIASFTFAPGAQPLSKQLASNPVWSQLKAVKNHQVFEVSPNSYIFGRGTISLGLALDDAMTKLYPDVFPQPLP